jgi:hypothetical protein
VRRTGQRTANADNCTDAAAAGHTAPVFGAGFGYITDAVGSNASGVRAQTSRRSAAPRARDSQLDTCRAEREPDKATTLRIEILMAGLLVG